MWGSLALSACKKHSTASQLQLVTQVNYADYLSPDANLRFALTYESRGNRPGIDVLQQNQGLVLHRLEQIDSRGQRTVVATIDELRRAVAPLRSPEQAEAVLFASDANLTSTYHDKIASFTDRGDSYVITVFSKKMFGCFSSPISVLAVTFAMDKATAEYTITRQEEIAKDTSVIGLCVD